jgi:dTMP kinase
METSAPGKWIVFEGLDGCGKSTQARLLAERLGAVLTREPGGTELGSSIRDMVLHASAPITVESEALLFAADRAQHYHEVVAPNLARGLHVVSDRSVWSSVVYQGYGRGLGVRKVTELNDWALGGRWPDVVVYLRSPDDVRQRRMLRELDRIESGGAEFYRVVEQGFEELSLQERWAVIGNGSVGEIAEIVNAAVRARL